ncbi:MAG: hypothetical protein IKR48_11150 [Kiritimatiellae bacterium]|nr:hypothetical protein [Kiritimatiellia bacterium]
MADAKIPILGWGTFPQEMASEERYLEARDAGFTHLTQMCKTPADAKRLLSVAEKAGIKLIIGYATHGLDGIKRMTDEAKAFTVAAKDSPALEFYYVTDEPPIRLAETIRECVSRYETLDPVHPCYVNLIGSLDEANQKRFTGCATYGEYVRRLYGIVPLKMISFDVYPVCALSSMENDLRLHGAKVFLKERWYETLEIASAFANEKGIPMYAFALATAHRHNPKNPYPVPTKAHLRLQLYSNLAYGAQMLQYFRYRAVIPAKKRGPLFELIREINQEVQARAYVFLGAKVQCVWHTGDKIPISTKLLDPKTLPQFVKSFSTPNNSTLVVSWLKNGTQDYLVIVNRDPNDEMSFTASFAQGVEIVRRDGTRIKADAYEDLFWLTPGDVAIFATRNQF